mmetsp:Transcript_23247/g.75161  ORF Transcript_23247/g.75161 Transcript_23247/m.75161 type:complete len:568 (+) Transcript_23247:4271-5974(+)
MPMLEDCPKSIVAWHRLLPRVLVNVSSSTLPAASADKAYCQLERQKTIDTTAVECTSFTDAAIFLVLRSHRATWPFLWPTMTLLASAEKAPAVTATASSLPGGHRAWGWEGTSCSCGSKSTTTPRREPTPTSLACAKTHVGRPNSCASMRRSSEHCRTSTMESPATVGASFESPANTVLGSSTLCSSRLFSCSALQAHGARAKTATPSLAPGGSSPRSPSARLDGAAPTPPTAPPATAAAAAATCGATTAAATAAADVGAKEGEASGAASSSEESAIAMTSAKPTAFIPAGPPGVSASSLSASVSALAAVKDRATRSGGPGASGAFAAAAWAAPGGGRATSWSESESSPCAIASAMVRGLEAAAEAEGATMGGAAKAGAAAPEGPPATGGVALAALAAPAASAPPAAATSPPPTAGTAGLAAALAAAWSLAGAAILSSSSLEDSAASKLSTVSAMAPRNHPYQMCEHRRRAGQCQRRHRRKRRRQRRQRQRRQHRRRCLRRRHRLVALAAFGAASVASASEVAAAAGSRGWQERRSGPRGRKQRGRLGAHLVGRGCRMPGRGVLPRP